MMKLLGIVVAGCLSGAGGMALAHIGMAGMSSLPIQVAETAANTVTISDFSFAPQSVTVAAGTVVTWVNHDDEPHTVVSADSPTLFKSGALDTNDTFTYTFDKPGTYQYFCSIHPHMTGTVVVK